MAEIDLGALRRNLDRFRAHLGGAGPGIYGVVKADAYGHGAVPVARALGTLCNALAVSLVEEGLELREAGIETPIIVLGAFYNRHHGEVIDRGLLPVVYDPADLDRFAAAAAARRRRVAVHLKVDTGMTRLGVSTGELPGVLDRIHALPALDLVGFCTHLASADLAGGPGEDQTVEQLGTFGTALGEAKARGFAGVTAHAANSAAAVRFPQARRDAVRPGLAIYGAMPSSTVALPELEPALRLATRVMAMHEIAAGATVSYGGVWRAGRPSRIATLPLGYADGYPRHVREAAVLLRGRRAPVVGNVCMDMLMVDVTDVPGAGLGDDVTLIGADGSDRITVDDLAGWAGTINYEILCGISKRVPRLYRES